MSAHTSPGQALSATAQAPASEETFTQTLQQTAKAAPSNQWQGEHTYVLFCYLLVFVVMLATASRWVGQAMGLQQKLDRLNPNRKGDPAD